MSSSMDDSVSSAADEQSFDAAAPDDRFCPGEDHVSSCARYLDQELRMQGLRSVLVKGSQRLNLPELLNTVYRLLQLRRSDQTTLDELRTRLQRGRSDVVMQSEISEKLKSDLRVVEKEVGASKEKERQLGVKIKSLLAKLRSEQDEVRRLKTSMQYKETQYTHEMRKREKEYSRLKDRLGQMVSDRGKQKQLGLSVLNALQRAGGKRRLWNQPGSHVEETYRAIVTSYEERQKAMLVENGSLRESLSLMQQELVSLLNEQHTRRRGKGGRGRGEKEEEDRGKEEKEEEEEEVVAEKFGGGLNSGHFQMPYDIVRDGIEKVFREHLQKLREKLQASQQPLPESEEKRGEDREGGGVGESEREGTRDLEGGGGGEKEEEEEGEGGEEVDVETLQNKLSDYRDIIGRQEEMLQKATSTPSSGENKSLSESWLWKEKEKVEGDKSELEELREQLEKDRLLLIDTARNLDRERQRFEDDKMAFLKEQFLDSSLFNNTTELDSFYSKLSSTPIPAISSAAPIRNLASRPPAQVDVHHDLSLCSDDGSPDVLNDSQTGQLPMDDDDT